MTRLEKQLNLWLRYWNAGACLRDALIACDREAKAKNSAARRKARDEATENLFEFWSCIRPSKTVFPKRCTRLLIHWMENGIGMFGPTTILKRQWPRS